MSVHQSHRLRVIALFPVLLSLLVCTACRRNTSQVDHTQITEPTLPPAVFEPTPPEPLDEAADRAYETAARTVFDGVAVADAADFTYEIIDDAIRLMTYHGDREKLVIPDVIDGKPVRALGDRLLADQNTLVALFIPDSVTYIGESLVSGCRSLQVLRLPQLGATRDTDGYLSYFFGGASAQEGAFRVPSSLDTVILSDCVKEIPAFAFFRCSRLRMVILPESVTHIGKFAFSGCTQLHFAPLPASLTDLGAYAFENCTSLLHAQLPDKLQSVGVGALAGCSSLRELTLPFLGGTPNDTESEHLGYLFGATAYTWNATSVPESLLSVTLRSGDVPDYAFYDCRHLAVITLPEDCTRVGTRAFWGCAALQEITLPDSVNDVGALAFAHCTTLCRVTLSNTLQSLGMQAFLNCTNLTRITLPDTLTSLANATFSGCANLTTLALGSGLREVGTAAFHGCNALCSLTPSTVSVTVASDNEPLLRLLSPQS